MSVREHACGHKDPKPARQCTFSSFTFQGDIRAPSQDRVWEYVEALSWPGRVPVTQTAPTLAFFRGPGSLRVRSRRPGRGFWEASSLWLACVS